MEENTNDIHFLLQFPAETEEFPENCSQN